MRPHLPSSAPGLRPCHAALSSLSRSCRASLSSLLASSVELLEWRRSRGEAMEISALLVLKPSSSAVGASSSGGGSGSEVLVLASATDVSHFSYFQRNVSREFIFIARTVAQCTPPSYRQSVQHEVARRIHTKRWA